MTDPHSAFIAQQMQFPPTEPSLFGQVELLTNLDLAMNQNIKSRVTYSVTTKRLHDDTMRDFIHRELESLGLAHNTFTEAATEPIIRSTDGVLRRCCN